MGASGRGCRGAAYRHHCVFGLPSGAVADAATAYAGLWRGLLGRRFRCRAARLTFGYFGSLGRSLGRRFRGSIVLVVLLRQSPRGGGPDVAPHGQSPGHEGRDDQGQCEAPRPSRRRSCAFSACSSVWSVLCGAGTASSDPFSSGTASSATGESDTPSDSTTMGCGACSTTRGPSFATGRSSDTAETVYAVLAFLFGLVVEAALLKWESS